MSETLNEARMSNLSDKIDEKAEEVRKLAEEKKVAKKKAPNK